METTEISIELQLEKESEKVLIRAQVFGETRIIYLDKEQLNRIAAELSSIKNMLHELGRLPMQCTWYLDKSCKCKICEAARKDIPSISGDRKSNADLYK